MLDTSFPYGNGSIFADDPQSKLQYAELSQNYSSTVYLMWDPAVPPAGQQTCSPAIASGDTVQPSTCASIPVPLGHVSWGACGDGRQHAGVRPGHSNELDVKLSIGNRAQPLRPRRELSVMAKHN